MSKNMKLLALWVLIFSFQNPLCAQIQVGNDIDGLFGLTQAGWSVSMSEDGSRVAIGSRIYNGGALNTGGVQIFDLVDGDWVQYGPILSGEAAQDQFGHTLSLSAGGRILVVGTPFNDNAGTSAGKVQVYDLSGGTITQIGSDINGLRSQDRFGSSVSISGDGNRIVVGASTKNSNGNSSGQTRVFEYRGGIWTQLGSSIDGEAAEDNSGWAVAMSKEGNRIAIGAPNNDGSGIDAGHVRIFQYTGSNWVQLGNDIDGEAAEDYSGSAISISSESGNRIAIGAYGNESKGTRTGHVRVFEFIGNSWVQRGIDIDGDRTFNDSGSSVSLSSDGSRLAVGEPGHDGIGSSFSSYGQVRVYNFDGSNWYQYGSGISGEQAAGGSGGAVSLSRDGRWLAIGAWGNDGNGNDSGHTRIFDLGGRTSINDLVSPVKVFSNGPGAWFINSPEVILKSVALFDLQGKSLIAEVSLMRNTAHLLSSYQGLAVLLIETERGIFAKKILLK